jgi:hypothetical protein
MENRKAVGRTAGKAPPAAGAAPDVELLAEALDFLRRSETSFDL